MVSRRIDNSAVAALWCSHCNQLEAAASCLVCHCLGNKRATFVLPHVVCSGCAQLQAPELVGALVCSR